MKEEFRNYSFSPLDSRMYVLVKNRRAMIIDPCESKEAKKWLREKQVQDITVFITHEHYDHISGINWLRKKFDKVMVYASASSAAALPRPSKNLSAYCDILFGNTEFDKKLFSPYSCYADKIVQDGDRFTWENHQLFIKETPGHSKGSICIILDKVFLFSGDTLLTGHDTIFRLPGGSKKDYEEITLPWMRTLDESLIVCPGHGDRQSLKQLKTTLK